MRTALILLIVTAFVAVYNAHPLFHDDQQNGPAVNVMRRSEAIDLLQRITREAANRDRERDGAGGGNRRSGGGGSACKYRKGQWSACDPQTKERTRTYTLKKGDAAACDETKTMRKQCKVKKGKQRNGNQKNRNAAAKVQSPEQTLRSS